MQEWEEKVIERQEAFEAGKMEGEAVGKAKGESVGKVLGEERMGNLIEHLLESDRTEDMKKALSDKDYRKKLYNEFDI